MLIAFDILLNLKWHVEQSVWKLTFIDRRQACPHYFSLREGHIIEKGNLRKVLECSNSCNTLYLVPIREDMFLLLNTVTELEDHVQHYQRYEVFSNWMNTPS